MNKYAVEMENISMIFNNTIIANKDVNFRVKKNEIHALVGENGAGKSTLMSILFGIYEPTAGQIKINGKVEMISNPIKASKLGIGMVHQHFKLVDIFPLWKNISLGSEELLAKTIINSKKIKEDIKEIMEKYNFNVDLNQKASSATVGAQQRTEILKILYRNADILVFDEPTAVLTPDEIDGLLQVMKEFQAAGKTIIFITHKMAEIWKVADSATVIRKGQVIDTFDISKTSPEELAEAMVGRKLVDIKNDYSQPKEEVVLKVDNISVKKSSNHKIMGLKNFSLKIRAGEIVAIAGVEGNGQQELVNAITGLSKLEEGNIFIKDNNISKESIANRYKKYKMSHIPEDRHKHGLVLDQNLLENMVLQDISTKKFSKYGILNFSAIQTYGQKILLNYDVRNAQSGFAIARQLSGGNQQKAIVGREMTRESDLIIIFQPTRGLDVGSIEFIHSQILEAKKEGKAILLVSYELSEVMALADRILVINSGELVGELPGKNVKKEEIGKLMLGKGG
ncbi:ribose/galactose ABC transporter ATP-binding protein [Spiroplasma floricola 23-6]|uniref:Ribose/galactose ABC transporter ATP-binding protein n=1 Tax=Spiroplasma floricola 23-6 TaxID=1336749 RepID=A0A2K8SDC3_9MOLU|nr:ABC transporter ATP-binding protein [Spiroplasma floricola]AUB31432.1 ribose/galactose ABC transporter ATP-binding protein [Spiroplasma floricola 23-6]